MSFVADHKGLYILSIILAIIGVACSMVPYYVVSKLIIGLVAVIKGSFVLYGLVWRRGGVFFRQVRISHHLVSAISPGDLQGHGKD